MPQPRPGRPSLGHTGHQGQLEGCRPCALRAWREARGLTQAGLARLLSAGSSGRSATHVRTVQRWERGETEIPGLLWAYLPLIR